MSVIRSRGILALSMHDGLLAPESGAVPVGSALDSAYGYFANVRIRWKVSPAAGMVRAWLWSGAGAGLDGLPGLGSSLKNSYRSVMKEEKESERGYPRIFLASLP